MIRILCALLTPLAVLAIGLLGLAVLVRDLARVRIARHSRGGPDRKH